MKVVRSMGMGSLALLVSASLAVAAPQGISNKAAPPNAKVYGKSLNDWLGAYWRWYYGTGVDRLTSAPAPFQPGPARVVFMPLPMGDDMEVLGGTGSSADPLLLRGEIHVTLPAGTGFVLPFWSWVSERYAGWPAVPDDIPISNALIRNVITNATVTLDGRPLVKDIWAQYVGPTAFDPFIDYPEPSSYSSVAAIAFQGAGVVVHPLPPGRHVLHLQELFRVTPVELAGYDFGLVYDNTWVIDVTPPGHLRTR